MGKRFQKATERRYLKEVEQAKLDAKDIGVDINRIIGGREVEQPQQAASGIKFLGFE